ncbi:GxxExxY protein [Niabella yanshanensis]|uniref:GxxExxY protein n=1 Tax=Niabella yanshanensis TaxID=577386 RepID=A0ABZ0WD02_9BACT|nr:GxxExxY protein [Niabella yanshanensis]WQD40511.1 GxxExxY protein [Niabella yanshanensis]
MDEPILFKEESYTIVGTCMEVHNNLGCGFAEIVYKDALEYEFNKRHIPFEREKKYSARYKDIVLPHYFYADFVVFNEIILEIKSVSQFTNEFTAQCINYLK